MKKGIISDTGKSAKTIAQQFAKQIVQELPEMGKSVQQQIVGSESVSSNNQGQPVEQKQQEEKPQEEKILEQKLQAQGQSQYTALETEMKEIRMRKKAKEDQDKALEEKQEVLDKNADKSKPLVAISTKPSRKLGIFSGKPKKLGPDLQAERQKVRVENPMSPPG